MEIRTLKYFLAIAGEENMTSAANILHVSQSALSRQMADLEEHLGTQLFVRTNRKTLLTADGMHLKKRAEEILSLIERTETEFSGTEEILYGEIHIGAGETRAMSLIANAIRRIQSRHPTIRFHIYSGNADDVTERLDRGLLDFGLLFESAGKEKYHYIPVPVRDTMGILTRRDSPYAGLDAITPSVLSNMTLLSSVRKSYYHSVLSDWLGSDMDGLHCAATYNLIYNASLMVEAGIGNALTIDGIINTANSDLLFIPLKPGVELGTIFVWKKDQMSGKAASLFLQEIKKEFASACYDSGSM